MDRPCCGQTFSNKRRGLMITKTEMRNQHCHVFQSEINVNDVVAEHTNVRMDASA